ncbi:MAG: hypothetical protein L0099_05840 [Acidobacteria bacterium]|nr:hypothetical protein [Acidobacteriota bacterium]
MMLNSVACIVAAIGLGAMILAQQPTAFRPRTVSRVATLNLDASMEKVFPLFDPVHEAEWAEGWEIEVLYPQDAPPARGMVFRTDHPPEGETVWIMTRFGVRAGEVEYVNVTPGLKLTWINIRCREAGEAATEAEVRYTVTALSERGNEYVEALDAKYTTWLEGWEEAINHYLRTRKQLPHHR